MDQNKKRNIWIGAGAILCAVAITVIIVAGGKESQEICNDESPVGFFEAKDNPKFTLGLARQEILNEDDTFSSLKNGVVDISSKEETFAQAYADHMNPSLPEDGQWTAQTVLNNSIFYENAYAWYYRLSNTASLTRQVKFPHIFDGGINCSINGSMIYLHAQDTTDPYIATIDLRKKSSTIPYFAVYGASAFGVMEVDFTLSFYQQQSDQSYTRYDYTFPATFRESTGTIPNLYGAYFDDPNLLSGVSMIGFSYEVTSWEYTPQEGEETTDEAFLKLYEILLPESTWVA